MSLFMHHPLPGVDMQESVTQASPNNGLHPYLEALRVSGVPAELILPQAEEMGADPDELLRIAKILLGSESYCEQELISLWVLIGVTSSWQPFIAKAIQLGLSFLLPLLQPPMRPSDPAIDFLGEERRKRLAPVILRRLGYPKILLGSHPLPVNPPDVLPWLDGGGSLWASTLEMQGFVALSLEWKSVMAKVLILRDAIGPDTLGRERWGYLYTRQPEPVARLFRVSGLRRLQGTGSLHSLTAVSCPDLANIWRAPKILVIKDCPSISNLVCRSQGSLLHLQCCAGLRSIDVEDIHDREAAPKGTLSCQTIVIDDCPNLRILPQQIKTGGDMTLRRMRTFTGWPRLIQIGGDLKIKDCPDLEELPPLEVSGSLRLEGVSGLRRLAPGSVIGRHLDLRACKHLEDIPRAVKVGGCLYLPSHLHRQASAFEDPEPLLDMPQDRYPSLRTLLVGLRFPELSRPEERCQLHDRTETVLESLRRELRENPRLEAELLWTASEVWRELSEEQWAVSHPWCESAKESDDELPMAWFRGLLISAS